jgi:methionyl-tRNA formyltransferase
MTRNIDAGNIYAQASIPADRSVWRIYQRTFALGANLFSEAIKNIQLNNPLFTIDPKQSSYYKQPTPGDIKRFRKMGFKYL